MPTFVKSGGRGGRGRDGALRPVGPVRPAAPRGRQGRPPRGCRRGTRPSRDRSLSAAERCCCRGTRRRGSAPGPLELCSAKVIFGQAVAVGGQPLMEVPQPWGLMWLSIHTPERSGASV